MAKDSSEAISVRVHEGVEIVMNFDNTDRMDISDKWRGKWL